MNGAAVAAAAAAAIAQAIKASGVLVQVQPEEFSKLVAIADDPLVVHAPARGMFSRKHRYLMSWRGLAFYTASVEPLELGGADTITAKSIWTPH